MDIVAALANAQAPITSRLVSERIALALNTSLAASPGIQKSPSSADQLI